MKQGTFVIGGTGSGKSTYMKKYYPNDPTFCSDGIKPAVAKVFADVLQKPESDIHKEYSKELIDLTGRWMYEIFQVLVRDTNRFVHETRASSPHFLNKMRIAETSSFEIQVDCIYRDPLDAYDNGVRKREEKEQRHVPQDLHTFFHAEEIRRWQEFDSTFGANSNIRFSYLHNDGTDFHRVTLAKILEMTNDFPSS